MFFKFFLFQIILYTEVLLLNDAYRIYGEGRKEDVAFKKMDQYNSQDNKILELLLSNYDKRIRPTPTNLSNGTGPVLVKVNIMLRMLSKIDVVNMVKFMIFIFILMLNAA